MAAGVPVVGVYGEPLPSWWTTGAGLLVSDDPRELGKGRELGNDVDLRTVGGRGPYPSSRIAVEVSAARMFDLYEQASDLVAQRPLLQAWARITPAALGPPVRCSGSRRRSVTSPAEPARCADQPSDRPAVRLGQILGRRRQPVAIGLGVQHPECS